MAFEDSGFVWGSSYVCENEYEWWINSNVHKALPKILHEISSFLKYFKQIHNKNDSIDEWSPGCLPYSNEYLIFEILNITKRTNMNDE